METLVSAHLFIGKMRSTPGTRGVILPIRSGTQRWSFGARRADQVPTHTENKHAGFGELLKPDRHTPYKLKKKKKRAVSGAVHHPRQPVSAAGLIMPQSASVPGPPIPAATLTSSISISHRLCSHSHSRCLPACPSHLSTYVGADGTQIRTHTQIKSYGQ